MGWGIGGENIVKKLAAILVLAVVVASMFAVIAPVLAGRPGGQYTVIVKDSNGNPVSDLWVRVAESNRDGSGASRWLKTDSTGTVVHYTGLDHYHYAESVGYLASLPASDPGSSTWPDMTLYDGRVKRVLTVIYPGTPITTP